MNCLKPGGKLAARLELEEDLADELEGLDEKERKDAIEAVGNRRVGLPYPLKTLSQDWTALF